MAMSERLVKKRSKKMAYQKSILSAVDFLVNRLASPVAEKGKKMTATYGLRCFALWENSSRGGYWAKMLQDSCQLLMFPGEEGELLEPFSTTWPRWGIVSDGRAMELAISGRRTKETGCSSWPTPNSLAASNDLNLCCSGDKRDKPNKLGWAVKRATPRASDGEHGGPNQRDSRGNPALPGAVKMWPTPKTPTGGGQTQRNTRGGGIRKLEDAISYQVGYNTGQLNADWVELLMGFSQGWTDIGCEKTKEWPGWPAHFVDRGWMTPTSGQCGSTSRTSGRPLERSTKIQAQVYVFDSENGQYDYEPPRVIQGQKNRAKRLKCLGNAVVPQQIYPILAAIAEIERCKDAI